MAALTLSNYLGMLQDDPENADAFEGLKQAVQNGGATNADEALRLIEAARVRHERRGEARAATWLIDLETRLVDGDPDFEAALFKELGRLRREELRDDAGALEAYRKALELRPGDDEVEEAIEQLEQTQKSWRQIADRFVEEAENASDATLRTSLLSRAASLVWQYKKRGAAKETDKLFKQALRSDPGDTRAARLYAEVLRTRTKWQEAAKVLLAAAENGRDQEERLHLYVRAGRIHHRQLDDKAAAAEAYGRVLDFAPGHPEALAMQASGNVLPPTVANHLTPR